MRGIFFPRTAYVRFRSPARFFATFLGFGRTTYGRRTPEVVFLPASAAGGVRERRRNGGGTMRQPAARPTSVGRMSAKLRGASARRRGPTDRAYRPEGASPSKNGENRR
jgi:hypothetical protein